ncbi:MAG: VanW family protein [Anaerolineae bacterium]|nr:VanW family protein [Anaerolineae bacterium]
MRYWFTRGTLALLVTGLIISVIGLFVLGPGLDSRIVLGVWMWQTSLGGMTPVDALPHVLDGLALNQPRVTLIGPDDQRWVFSPADLGVDVEVNGTLAQAYGIGHIQQGSAALMERAGLLWQGRMVSPVLSWDNQRAASQLNALAIQLNRIPQDARVIVVDGQLTLEPGLPGRRLEVTQTLQSLVPLLQSPEPAELLLPVTVLPAKVSDTDAGQALDIAQTILSQELTLVLPESLPDDSGPWSLPVAVMTQRLVIHSTDTGEVWVGLDVEFLTQFLAPLAVALHRDPVDSHFYFNENTGELDALNPSANGRDLNIEDSIAQVNERLRLGEHTIPLVLTTIEPRYPDTLKAADLGIRELVAVGESYFTGSSSSRDKNIGIGAARFNGIMLEPGQVFSFNEYLGDVTPEEGYDESYVIIGNRTVPGVGGGICQVATTAFRAAFFGGYEIIERWPHAYRVGYYELGGFGPGFDATIYSPLVDFRFKNDTPYHLLIQTQVDAARSRLQFRLYSTNDGRTVEQIGPTWGEPIPPGPPVYEYDATLPSGTSRKLESAHDGLDAVLERIVRDTEGNILHQDRFVSNFVPWSARYLYGPNFIIPAGADVISSPTPEAAP